MIETARHSGIRASPEVETEVVRLVRDGQTRGQLAQAVRKHLATVSGFVRDTEGLGLAHTGSSSAGTLEAMAKARGLQSEFARNRRATPFDRIMDATEKTLDLLESTTAPRERQFLSQALRNHTVACADLTARDTKAAPDMQMVVSIFDKFDAGMETFVAAVPSPRTGLIQD